MHPHPPSDEVTRAAALVTKARSILVADYPWFGTLATRLHARPAPSVGTLATDGTRLLYSPAFVCKQPAPELLGGIAHEVMHCAMLHPFRFGGHDHGEWNISCDYAINGILIDAGFTLPNGSLYEPAYRNMSAEQIYAKRRADRAANPPPPPPPPPPGGEEDEDGEDETGYGPGPEPEDDQEEDQEEDQDEDDEEGEEPTEEPTDEPTDEEGEEEGEEPQDEPTEEEPSKEPPASPPPTEPEPEPEPETAIGRMLPAPPKDAPPPADADGDGDSDSDDQDGDPGDGEPGDGWSEADWMMAAAAATMLANKAGKAPAAAIRAAAATRQPVTDWREVLRRFIEQATSRDQSWTTPNRRYIASDVYLPGNTPTDAPRLGVLVDTSGSIDRTCLDQFASELNGIMREVRPEAVDVVYCDSAVAGVQEFSPDGSDLELTPAGGGGTNMDPGFAWFTRRADEGTPVCAVVCFTDLDFWSIPQEPDGYPVLWVCYPWVTMAAPWGETVRLSA